MTAFRSCKHAKVKLHYLAVFPALIFHPGLSLDACSFAVAFISLKVVLRKIHLTQSFSYITVAGQMAGNMLKKDLHQRYFLVNFVKFPEKAFAKRFLVDCF